MTLFDEFKKLMRHEQIDESFLVPLLIWVSGSQSNIELCQRINKRFYTGNRKIYIDEVILCNSIRHIVKYPKVAKDDEKLKKFYNDVCSYFNWTYREFQKNLSVLNLEELKPVIAKAFGYNNIQRKLIGLGANNYGKTNNKRRNK